LWESTAQVSQLWAGSIKYPPFAYFEPLNITVFNNKTANINWVWDSDAAGQKCAPSTDGVGLTWSVSGNTVTASSPSAYYKFTGTISGDVPPVISGDILHGTDTVGTWSVVQNAPQLSSLCGQPGPANIWPLPSSYKMGGTTLMVRLVVISLRRLRNRRFWQQRFKDIWG
jgi:hypothetical protein